VQTERRRTVTIKNNSKITQPYTEILQMAKIDANKQIQLRIQERINGIKNKNK
jgi:hypothetical protein